MRCRFNPPALGSIKAAAFRRSGGSSRSFGSIGSGAAHSLACGDENEPSVVYYIAALSQLDTDLESKNDFDELVNICADLPASVLDLGTSPADELKTFNKDLFNDTGIPFEIDAEKSQDLYCMLKKIRNGASVESVATSLEDYETLGLNAAEVATLKTIAGNEAKIVLTTGDITATLTAIKDTFDKIKSKGVDPFGLFVLYSRAREIGEAVVARAFKQFYGGEAPAEESVEITEEARQQLVASGERVDVPGLISKTQSSFDRLKTIATAMKMGAAEAAARHTADSFSNASGGRRNKRIRTGDTFTTNCNDADRSSRIIGTLIELGDWSGRKNECSILLDPRLSLM